jgi:hypothetical protein
MPSRISFTFIVESFTFNYYVSRALRRKDKFEDKMILKTIDEMSIERKLSFY